MEFGYQFVLTFTDHTTIIDEANGGVLTACLLNSDQHKPRPSPLLSSYSIPISTQSLKLHTLAQNGPTIISRIHILLVLVDRPHRTQPSVSRQMSTSSIQSIADLLVTASSSRLAESNTEAYREEGLRHAKIKLDAR